VVIAGAAACGDDDDAVPTATAAPPTAAPAASPTAVTAAITIDEPRDGNTVSSPFRATGTASVFEGALTVDVLGDAGTVLCTRNVQASEGGPGRGDWSGVLAFPPPLADAPVTLRAYSFSADDGSRENVVERSLTASARQPSIVITAPACAASVPQTAPLEVSGMALVFEAALNVDVRDAAGTVLVTQRVMAASGTEFSPWSATLDLSALPGPGLYDLVAYNFSARDGAIENEFPIQILVGP
jgi:hypothetical protein